MIGNYLKKVSQLWRRSVTDRNEVSKKNQVQHFSINLPKILEEEPPVRSHKSAVKRNEARRKKAIRKRDRKAMKRQFHASDVRRRR